MTSRVSNPGCSQRRRTRKPGRHASRLSYVSESNHFARRRTDLFFPTAHVRSSTLDAAARRDSALPPDDMTGPKVSPPSGLTFSSPIRMNVAQPKRKCTCPGVIRSIHFPVMNRGPYAEQRTSCGLYDRASQGMPGHTNRLQGGVAPVDPHQREGKPPLLDTPPAVRGVRA
jgi:hypothetical protein